MTACRNDRRLVAATIAACISGMFSAGASADQPVDARSRPAGWQTVQVGEPVQLFPRSVPGQVAPGPGRAPPVVLTPGAEPPAPAVEPPATAAASDFAGATDGRVVPRDIPIESVVLGDLSPDSAGLLGPDEGGLGIDMWRGTDRELLESLLPRIPEAFGSAVLRDLAIRLLLSRASAPPGEAGGKSLLVMRAERLVAMGEVTQAIELLEAGPPITDDPALARMAVDSRFIDNDNAGACAEVRDAADRYDGEYWQKAQAYCLALSGEFARAIIVSDILREHGGAEKDPAFFALVEALAGSRGVTVDSLPDPHGLKVSLMRAANVRLPEDVLETSSLAVLENAAFSPNADLELRLEAAERLAAARAVSRGELADLYNSVPFTQDELADPIAFANGDWGPRGRALLVKALTLAQTAEAKAGLFERAWALARKRGGEDMFLWASAPALGGLTPSKALLEDARPVASALFAAGELEKAMEWCELARDNSHTAPAAERAWRALWPLAVLADAGGEMIWDDTRLNAWWSDRVKTRPDSARAAATMVYSLLESFGHTVDGPAWARLVSAPAAPPSQAPDIALRRALEDASNEGRRGETVLYAVIALGQGGKEAANPTAVAAVVQALRRVGLETEARALAVEAAVAAGA